MNPSLKRNGYSGGIVGVNGAKTRTNVISLEKHILLAFMTSLSCSLIQIGDFTNKRGKIVMKSAIHHHINIILYFIIPGELLEIPRCGVVPFKL